MGRLNTGVAAEQGPALTGVRTPQQPHQGRAPLRQRLNGGGRDLLPAQIAVRACLACPYRKNPVHEHNPLVAPRRKIPVGWGHQPGVGLEFLINVL